MKEHDTLTLNQIRQSPKFAPQAKAYRVSDFVSKKELTEMRTRRATNRAQKQRPYDDIDALIAEVVARFGYEVYYKWNAGEIKTETLMKWVRAERARERASALPLEAIVAHMVGACIRRHKGERAPKGPQYAQKIIKQELKAAKGEV